MAITAAQLPPGMTMTSSRSCRVPLQVALPKAASGTATLVATVYVPAKPVATPTVVCALPGGGYSRGYFDLRFPGHAEYSEAEHHVKRGIVYVALDHLGVGESSTDANDRLVIEDIAAANHEAVRQLIERL